MANIEDINKQTAELKAAIAQLEQGANSLTKTQRKLLETVGLLGKQTTKEIENSMAALREQLKLLKEREGSEKEVNEQISLNNRLRQKEVDILQSQIREAQQFEQEYEERKEEALKKQNNLLKEHLRLDKEIAAAQGKVDITGPLRDKQKALKEQAKLQIDIAAGLDDRHKKITSNNKEVAKGDQSSLAALLLQRKRKKDILVADEGIQAGMKSLLKTFTGLSDKGLGFFKSMLDFKNLMDAEPLEDLEEGEERLTGMQQVVVKLKDVFEALGGPLALLGAAFAAVGISTLKWMKDFDKAASDFRKNTGIIDKGLMGVEQSIVNVQRANIRMGVSTDEAFAAQSALTGEMAAFTSMTDDAQQKLLQVTTVMGEFGVSAQTTAQIFNKFSKGLGYDANQLEKLSTQLMAISESLKMPPQIIAEDFNQASTELMKYGDDMIDVFKGLEEQSKATGIGMQELLGIAKQFDTFEDAGNAVGRLNAILGGPYLNAIQMVYATEEERIKAMRESIQMSGQQFKDMNRFEQQAIATAAGIDDMSLAARLFGGTESEFADTTMTMKEMQERAIQAQAVWDKFGQIFDTVAIALTPFVYILGFLADTLLIALSPLGEIARLLGKDSDMIAGIGMITTAVTLAAAAFAHFSKMAILAKLSASSVLAPVAAFGVAFGAVITVLNWFNKGAPRLIASLVAIGAAIALAFTVPTFGVSIASWITGAALVGVAAAGVTGALSSYHQGSGGPVAEQFANLQAGESREDRRGNTTPITQTGVQKLDAGDTVHSAGHTRSRRYGGTGKSASPGMTADQGNQIISLLTQLNTPASEDAGTGEGTPIILVMDPAGTKVIAKGLIKQGDVRKDTTEKLKTHSGLTITKA